MTTSTITQDGFTYQFKSNGASCWDQLMRLARTRWEPNGKGGLLIQIPPMSAEPRPDIVFTGFEDAEEKIAGILKLITRYLGPVAFVKEDDEDNTAWCAFMLPLPYQQGEIPGHEMLEIEERVRAALLAAGAGAEEIDAALND